MPKKFRQNVLSLFSESGQWRFILIALVMCACEWILVGINMIFVSSDLVIGLPFVVLGTAAAAVGVALFADGD